jgi:hypothetical protein
MKPKTKAEKRTHIKLSLPQSLNVTFDTTRKEADELGFDWNGTMVDALADANTKLSRFLAQHRARVKPNAGPASGPELNQRKRTVNGADQEPA